MSDEQAYQEWLSDADNAVIADDCGAVTRAIFMAGRASAEAERNQLAGELSANKLLCDALEREKDVMATDFVPQLKRAYAAEAERDQWKAAAEDRSRKYLEARGAWQLASDDRAALEAERDRLAAQVEALTEAAQRWDDDQSEWLIDEADGKVTVYCGACDNKKEYGHTKNCPRMALRDALAALAQATP